jgi:hypothetical protein
VRITLGGPTYTFIAKSDGTFRYEGEYGVERLGDYSGTIPVVQFNALANFIKARGNRQSDHLHERGHEWQAQGN